MIYYFVNEFILMFFYPKKILKRQMGCDPIEGGGCASCAKASFQLQMQQIQQEKLVSEKSEWMEMSHQKMTVSQKKIDSYDGQTKYLCDQKVEILPLELNF